MAPSHPPRQQHINTTETEIYATYKRTELLSGSKNANDICESWRLSGSVDVLRQISQRYFGKISNLDQLMKELMLVDCQPNLKPLPSRVKVQL